MTLRNMLFLLCYNLKIGVGVGGLTFEGGNKNLVWGSLLGWIFPGRGNEQIFGGSGDRPPPPSPQLGENLVY